MSGAPERCSFCIDYNFTPKHQTRLERPDRDILLHFKHSYILHILHWSVGRKYKTYYAVVYKCTNRLERLSMACLSA
jgi:hypothetical protein